MDSAFPPLPPPYSPGSANDHGRPTPAPDSPGSGDDSDVDSEPDEVDFAAFGGPVSPQVRFQGEGVASSSKAMGRLGRVSQRQVAVTSIVTDIPILADPTEPARDETVVVDVAMLMADLLAPADGGSRIPFMRTLCPDVGPYQDVLDVLEEYKV